MTVGFTQIDLKFGLEINYPPVVIEHSYLEHLLKVENRWKDAQFWVGKLYDGIESKPGQQFTDGVTVDDLERLQRQGKSIIFTSGRTAYFSDPETATFLATRLYQHPSDAVAYGSLPVSDAQASTAITDRKAQLLVINDESPQRLTPELEQQILQTMNSASLAREKLAHIAAKLGDCYMLVSPALAVAVEATPNTPFQFRAGSPS
jgi:hypothetical protein